MQRTVRFSREPTLAQAAAILAGMERYLDNLGADVGRDTGGIRFRFGAPWRPDVLRTLGPLAIVEHAAPHRRATTRARRPVAAPGRTRFAGALPTSSWAQ